MTTLQPVRWEEKRRNLSPSLFYRVQRALPTPISSGGGQTEQVFTAGLAQSPRAASDRTGLGIKGFSEGLITVNIG